MYIKFKNKNNLQTHLVANPKNKTTPIVLITEISHHCLKSCNNFGAKEAN